MAEGDNKEASAMSELAEKTEKIFFDDEGNTISKKAFAKLQKEKDKEAKRIATQERLDKEKAEREAQSVDYATELYGTLPLNRSQARPGVVRTRIAEISAALVGQTITVRARVHTTRATAQKLCFMLLRQQDATVQAVCAFSAERISKQMVKFVQSVSCDSIIEIEALVVRPPEPIKSASVHDAELQIATCRVVSAAHVLPFKLDDALRPPPNSDGSEQAVEAAEEGPGEISVSLSTRLNHRIVDLRTQTNHAIFRVSAGVQRLFREFLDARGFLEIHSPKIIATASEGGASVFEVSYFKTAKAFLAQSPQFYKQMMITADYERVYEIGPVFRAEQSNTYRHLAEFTGVDLEMAFMEHYHEVLDLFDALFVHIFRGLAAQYAAETELVRRYYGGEAFRFLDKSLRLDFAEAVRMLREEAGVEMGDMDDLTTKNEKVLGGLVRERYGTDFFMLDKFPLAVRPFYTMADPADERYSNSYDFFMRGNEILSGAQRVHDPEMLTRAAEAKGVALEGIRAYVDAFKYGAPPHAGGGIGLERVVMLYLNIPNVRLTSLFPRDPQRLEP